MSDAPARVADEIRSAAARLAAAGIDSARRDAEWLMAHVLSCDPGRLIVVDTIDDARLREFRTAVEQRTRRIPLQHIVGSAPFGPLELAVGPGVFIPRPETEYLLEWAASAAATMTDPVRIVDLCSGSGALAIGLATLVRSARVTAVEVDDDALKWLRRNVSDAPAVVRERLDVVAADVTDAEQIGKAIPPGSVSVVVTNPPYVPMRSEVGPEVDHDPARAVYGGDDGMSVIVPMVPIIATMLSVGGLVGIEHDDTTSGAVVDCLRAHGAFDEVTARTDLAGRPRFVTARRVG
ncbi:MULTISPECIES: peptide chain release factor N(5)-glutamine methyltransferase [Gordonia]|jgi:release factor glutamine methyltransferase|uniref:peptide chain release factor N(5)-glutamine methyltransferase n=2 Tax=Gordonia alkanivorans TaxID=84096 RepID=F9W0R2_9ACTN|nr:MULTISPECIES: peptide chain release factor N(5)-glutamine methyltransferase [Gordonia]ETA08913.1 modification methylase HemK [Gordonia alkanivorans CGMCC 6845]MDH3005578.1 peptide chain release factor N(5)-glutamine methyltransferase [Gordonia alkanivorans]MDH3014991.1 peptide chain release factor N(5)-glutamine methyltransferase [Gordonia alkanivorans]MDH3018925.1 peptide chain release factor N(5)-glutamine methyltransferase [Gordonia alkanivorans]MDH3023212.1 peptide chain release factor 